MKKKMLSLMKTILAEGLAASELVVRSMENSFVFGVEHLFQKEEPLYQASFGCLEDIASKTGKGFCINGVDYLRSVEHGRRNFVVFGGTGTGKSSVVALGNLLSLSGPSCLCHDPSGQLLNISAPYLISEGYTISVLDFNDPEHSVGINVLDFIKKPEDANKLAAHLVRSALGTQAPDKFWELSSASLIRLLILLVLRMDVCYRNMANVHHLLTMLAGEPKEVDKLMVKHGTDEMFLEYKALIKGNEKTLSSIVMSAQSALSMWNHDGVRRITAVTTMDISALRTGKHVLFLKNSTSDAPYYRPLLSLIIEEIIGVFMERLPVKGQDRDVWFILDETDTLSLSSLPQVVSNNRKYGLAFMLFFQNVAQVYHGFGEEAGNNLMANCFSKLYLSGMDLRTASELEQVVGKTTVRDARGQQRIVPLFPSQNIQIMPPHEALLICSGQKPFKLRLVPYYDNPYLRRRASKGVFRSQGGSLPHCVTLIPTS
jgi:type IV secretory pathway TraG/TraD family ATPase VirD4